MLDYGCPKKKRWHAKEAWPKKKRERERKGVAMSEKYTYIHIYIYISRDDKRESEPTI